MDKEGINLRDKYLEAIRNAHDDWETLAFETSWKKRISDISEKNEGKEVVLAGWVHSIRDIGGLTFITLRDESGKIQVKLKSKPEEKLERESAVRIRGVVRKDSRAPN
ncbi:hypothetical protein KJ780_00060 [Candidatus Micrarchaeota archaeon]|nr:hypothetical protein [Candidatus Micrarchaeota archaeon]